MTQPHIPAHDADSLRGVDAASTPSYPERSTAQGNSATQARFRPPPHRPQARFRSPPHR